MRLFTLLFLKLAWASCALAVLIPPLPRVTSPPMARVGARQASSQTPTTTASLHSTSETCFDHINSIAFELDETPGPTPDSTLQEWYMQQLTSRSAATLSFSKASDLQTLRSNYSVYCTIVYADVYAQTQTVPASISSAHSSFNEAWTSWANAVRPAIFSVASRCLYDIPETPEPNDTPNSWWAGDLILWVASDTKDCITAYDVMAFGATSFVDARTTGISRGSSSSTTAGVAARETGLVMAAVAVAGVVGAGMM